jgi:hypothetical protein
MMCVGTMVGGVEAHEVFRIVTHKCEHTMRSSLTSSFMLAQHMPQAYATTVQKHHRQCDIHSTNVQLTTANHSSFCTLQYSLIISCCCYCLSSWSTLTLMNMILWLAGRGS